MGSMDFEPLHPDFGAKVRGVSLVGEIADETVEEIKKAIDTYSLLCFPDQPMNDEAQIAFTRKLGEPEAEHVTFGKTGKIVYFGTVGNVLEDGSKREGTHPNTRYQQGNELWHSDSSFRDIPSYLSINHAYEVLREGGETEFSSMRIANQRLPEEMKLMIEGLRCIHCLLYTSPSPRDRG